MPTFPDLFRAGRFGAVNLETDLRMRRCPEAETYPVVSLQLATERHMMAISGGLRLFFKQGQELHVRVSRPNQDDERVRTRSRKVLSPVRRSAPIALFRSNPLGNTAPPSFPRGTNQETLAMPQFLRMLARISHRVRIGLAEARGDCYETWIETPPAGFGRADAKRCCRRQQVALCVGCLTMPYLGRVTPWLGAIGCRPGRIPPDADERRPWRI